MNILSVDFGTSSVKLSVVDEQLNILDSAKVSYQIRVTNGDWIELDGDVVFDAMLEGIRKLSAYAGSIGVIGFDTFSPSMTFMDEDGNALHPVLTPSGPPEQSADTRDPAGDGERRVSEDHRHPAVHRRRFGHFRSLDEGKPPGCFRPRLPAGPSEHLHIQTPDRRIRHRPDQRFHDRHVQHRDRKRLVKRNLLHLRHPDGKTAGNRSDRHHSGRLKKRSSRCLRA